MTADLIFYAGIIICVIAAAGAAVSAILLRLLKKRLNRQLDSEYGKRRHK